MKNLFAPAILLTLAACSSTPEPQLFAGHDAPEVKRFVLHRMADGSAHMDVLYSDGKVRHGVHALGDGPDIYDSVGQDAVAVNLGDE